MGDFNTTVYSPDLQKFSNDTPSVRNIVARPWPACSWFGYGELACARIDFVFAPAQSVPVALEVGDETSSDHRSVIAEIILRSQ
jgi:endonuclease/exonuclease/phosphatase (EEP) superfamily protein YafD